MKTRKNPKLRQNEKIWFSFRYNFFPNLNEIRVLVAHRICQIRADWPFINYSIFCQTENEVILHLWFDGSCHYPWNLFRSASAQQTRRCYYGEQAITRPWWTNDSALEDHQRNKRNWDGTANQLYRLDGFRRVSYLEMALVNQEPLVTESLVDTMTNSVWATYWSRPNFNL